MKFHVLLELTASFTASNSSADRASCFDAPAGSYSEGTNTINGVLFKATSAIECTQEVGKTKLDRQTVT